MGAFVRFYASSVGAKVVMAATGLVWSLFLIGHMLGNWQVFQGAAPLNAYAHFLHTHVAMLWTVRTGLVVTFALHVFAASRLTLANQAARPQAYAKKTNIEAGWASRNMYLTGAMILAFVTYHLLQFTYRVMNPELGGTLDALGQNDVYSMVVGGFQIPAIAGAYMAAMVLLGLHLSHGVASLFQTLGLCHAWKSYTHAFGLLFAMLVIGGNLAMPVAILAGWIR